MASPDVPRVLLLWPGGMLGAGGNFGVPQLLLVAGEVRRRTGARVDVVDLDLERALGPVDLGRIGASSPDVVGISCYSSFEYLKVMAIAARVRAVLPRARLVAGGYHPSACPDDFLGPDSPFDHVVVGDGEGPMARVVAAAAAGGPAPPRVLGPDAVADPDALDPYDWSLLDRYRPVARKVASQAEIYLSRGCPYDCAFCMERAKRDTSWRAMDPDHAVEEIGRLDRFLDLSSWTLFVVDALFGMKADWRKRFLEGLVRRPPRARKIWLLIRLDLVDREDLALMARANVAPGFGLESGDPDQLRTIRKAGRLAGWTEKMDRVARWARDLGVPFGANVIVGHPGETEASLRATAQYLRRLFLGDARGTTGFLSVDPFRLYPGSAVAEEREAWERRTGMRVHRWPWWHDGDPDFLSEWIDPSASLDYRRTLALRRELLDPIVREIPGRFAYGGPARDYFERALREQVDVASPRRALRSLGMWHLWRGLAGEVPDGERRAAIEADVDLAATARAVRAAVLARGAIAGPREVLDAIERVPRERFVPVEHVAESADDRPLPIGPERQGGSVATVSALHAYAASFGALELGAGDEIVDLGAGTGYGAAVAAEAVGPTGRVVAVEIDPALAALARRNLEPWPRATVVEADARDVAAWRCALAGGEARKVSVAFAVEAVPAAWIEALAPGGVLVAPVGPPAAQVLTRVERTADGARTTEIGPVRYVPDRSRRAGGAAP